MKQHGIDTLLKITIKKTPFNRVLMGKYILFVISCLCLMLNSLYGQVRYYDYSSLNELSYFASMAACHMDSIADSGDTHRFLVIKVYSDVDTMLFPASLKVSEASDSSYSFNIGYDRREMISNDTFAHRFIGLAKGESLTYMIPIKCHLQQNTGYCIAIPSFWIRLDDDEKHPFEASSQSYLISLSSSIYLDQNVISYNALDLSHIFNNKLEPKNRNH